MKTVPTIRVADSTDTVVLADLPEEIALAMSDIASAAREGLLAMSVAAGMAVMAAMFEAESTEACGPKGKHNPDRVAVRHGSEKGSVALGGRRVSVTRPRARTTDGHEGPLASYAHFAAEGLLPQVGVGGVGRRVVLAGVPPPGAPPPGRAGRAGRGQAEVDVEVGDIAPVRAPDRDRA